MAVPLQWELRGALPGESRLSFLSFTHISLKRREKLQYAQIVEKGADIDGCLGTFVLGNV